MEIPIHKRKFISFISHAHVDKKIIDSLDNWLSNICGLSIWYDGNNLPISAKIVSHLSKAIENSKSMMIILSQSSVQSGWVEEEYNAAIYQRNKFPDYKIIPIRIDDCEIPSFLQTTKWIQLENGVITQDIAFELLFSLYYLNNFSDINMTKDIYIARSWRRNEKEFADEISLKFMDNGYRLIGDSKDQIGFDIENRIKSLIESCGGMIAILPNRGDGQTSSYIIQEISIAKSIGIPVLCIAEKGVNIDTSEVEISSIFYKDNNNTSLFDDEIDRFNEKWQKPLNPHYLFYAQSINKQVNDNKKVELLIEIITGIKCILGDEIHESEIQKVITSRIKRALIVLADITGHNLNTCIEVGIARGSGRNFHLISKKPRIKPPFMFRDQQIWFYSDEVEKMGLIHKILLPYKRRVINYELIQKNNF